MVCDFTKVGKYLICKKCGRKLDEASVTRPVAVCRIPPSYRVNSKYIYNDKMKGLGDYLSQIFKTMGYDYPTLGKVRARLTFLNKRSLTWCRNNQDIIASWIKDECKNREIDILPSVARSIVRLGILKTYSQS